MIIILELLNSSTKVGVGDDVFSQRGFDSEISALFSFRVSHTGSPFCSSIHSQLSSIQQRLLQGHVCSRKGFSAENRKSFTGSSNLSLPSKPKHHSHHRYHTPVPDDYQIRSCSSGAVISNFGIRGREQLNLQINSLSCLETSELPHVSGILSHTGRLSILQILSFIRHLLH